MRTSEQINELAAALSKAQGQFENAKKDSENPFFHSKYADLAACIDAARGPLAANGLAVVQSPSIEEARGVRMTTRLLHSSGQWIEGELDATPKDSGPQSVGSVVTYLRRYALCAMIGLAAEDDDANSGQGVEPKEKIARNARGWAKNDIPAAESPKAAVSKYAQTQVAIKSFVGTPEQWKAFMTRCCNGVHQLAAAGELTAGETQELKQMLQDRVPEFILKESPVEALLADAKKPQPVEHPF